MLCRAIRKRSRSCARLSMLSVNGPWNIAGKSVKISKIIISSSPLAYMCYNSTVASYWQALLPRVHLFYEYPVSTAEPSMSWSQIQRSEDAHDQMTILIGSTIRLLGGECGVFVVSNEAFDPQSSSEYTLYRLDTSALSLLLSYIQEGIQPTFHQPLIVETITPSLAVQLGYDEEVARLQGIERCVLAIDDLSGSLGMLCFLRPATLHSCFERST